jgi:hypothetical protein
MVAPKKIGRWSQKHNLVEKKYKTWKIPSFELLRQQFGGKVKKNTKKIRKKVYKNRRKRCKTKR